MIDKGGGSNSRYFHSMVRWKIRKNALRGVKIGGEWVDEPKRIKEEVREYFLKMIGIGGGEVYTRKGTIQINHTRRRLGG